MTPFHYGELVGVALGTVITLFVVMVLWIWRDDRRRSVPVDGKAGKAMFDLVDHLRRQRSFSVRTFGPGPRTHGIIAHVKKELQEIAAEPFSLEWIDVVILGFDGALRAGFSAEEIVSAFQAKLVENENRRWPDWQMFGQDEVIEHVRPAEEKTAPWVVPQWSVPK